MRLTRPRYQPLADSDLAAEHRAVLAALPDAWRGLNIFRTVARAPQALQGMLGASHYIRSERNALAPREREIVILRIGWLCGSGYEWTQHVFLGRDAGLTKAEIAALKGSPDAPLWSLADQALIQACDELHADQFIGEATWSRLSQHFDDKARMDLVFTAGHYLQVSMIVNTFGVQLDPGQRLDPDLSRPG